jgi:hypothetical protein
MKQLDQKEIALVGGGEHSWLTAISIVGLCLSGSGVITSGMALITNAGRSQVEGVPLLANRVSSSVVVNAGYRHAIICGVMGVSAAFLVISAISTVMLVKDDLSE